MKFLKIHHAKTRRTQRCKGKTGIKMNFLCVFASFATLREINSAVFLKSITMKEQMLEL